MSLARNGKEWREGEPSLQGGRPGRHSQFKHEYHPGSRQQLHLLRLVLPAEAFGELGGGEGLLPAVLDAGDVDDVILDSGRAAVMAALR